MAVTIITPAWSCKESVLALLCRGDMPSPAEDIRLPLWRDDSGVGDWPIDAAGLPDHGIVRFDLGALPENAAAVFAALRQAAHPVWLTGVDSASAMQQAGDLAPDAVFGLFWRDSGKPSGNPDQATLLRLLALLNADAENKDIERALSGSPHLLFGLLRLVNSVAVAGNRQRINGIGHAITMLGRRQLQRWVMLLLYAERYDSADMFSPLLTMTCVRARLMETLCRQSEGELRRQADTAFMIGMLSLLDRVLGEPMETLLGRVALPADGEAALLRGEGPFAPLLDLARAGEEGDAMAVSLGLAALGVSEASWGELSLSAWAWIEQLREGG